MPYPLILFFPSIPVFFLVLMFLTRKHLLLALLLLEGAPLILSLLVPIFSTPHSLFLIPVILTFSACEASLGLALLVMMVRYSGSDLIKSLTINKC